MHTQLQLVPAQLFSWYMVKRNSGRELDEPIEQNLRQEFCLYDLP